MAARAGETGIRLNNDIAKDRSISRPILAILFSPDKEFLLSVERLGPCKDQLLLPNSHSLILTWNFVILFSVERLREHWEEANSKVAVRKNQLDDMLLECRQFDESKAEFHRWRQSVEDEISAQGPIGQTPEVLEKQIQEHKVRSLRLWTSLAVVMQNVTRALIRVQAAPPFTFGICCEGQKEFTLGICFQSVWWVSL